VLCLVLLFGGALSLYFLFSTGQVSATRQRLDNAADAAAWSAALWRARVMNYHAYANRAIVAQEVAVAQAVTLTAWAKYFEQFTQTASVLAAGYPPVAAVLRVGAGLARSARELAEEAAAEEIAARSAYKSLLATSQEILQRSVDTFGLGAVANEVARANDRRFFAFALPDAQNFTGITRRYTGDDRARRALRRGGDAGRLRRRAAAARRCGGDLGGPRPARRRGRAGAPRRARGAAAATRLTSVRACRRRGGRAPRPLARAPRRDFRGGWR